MFLASLRHKFSVRARKRRFLLFEALLASFPRPAKILDVGGTQLFWEEMNCTHANRVEVTLLNIAPQEVSLPNFKSVSGDACNLSHFPDQSFDVVFSNSVIEHLFSFNRQQNMADEVVRVGRAYFIQTPNFAFPLEPHFNVLFFHYLPKSIRIFLLMKFDLGNYWDINNIEQATDIVNEIALLSRSQMAQLFPDAAIKNEKFLFFNKSIIAMGVKRE